MNRFAPLLIVGLVCLASYQAAAETPISIVNTQGLGFGQFTAGTGGTVTVSPNEDLSAGGGVALLSSSVGVAAQFTVSGEADSEYTISLPADGEAVLTNGNGQTLSLSNFTSTPNGAGQIGPGGTQTLSIGATLNVGNNQPSGNYSGQFSVIVDYF